MKGRTIQLWHIGIFTWNRLIQARFCLKHGKKGFDEIRIIIWGNY